MWGLFYIIILVIGGFIYSCKNCADDVKDRKKSIDNGDEYYFDHVGKKRRVDNNHQVMRTFQKNGSSYDDVMMDIKTGQVLHNYSEDERLERTCQENECSSANRTKREQALADGKYFYTANDEPPIACGLYEDMHARQYAKNPLSIQHWQYPLFHYRRVSDNLLLSKNTRSTGVIEEARYNLRIWDEEAEHTNDAYMINLHVKHNKRIIENWDSRPHCYWHEQVPYPTSAEVKRYAREVGAYLDEREVVNNEDNDEWLYFDGLRVCRKRH